MRERQGDVLEQVESAGELDVLSVLLLSVLAKQLAAECANEGAELCCVTEGEVLTKVLLSQSTGNFRSEGPVECSQNRAGDNKGHSLKTEDAVDRKREENREVQHHVRREVDVLHILFGHEEHHRKVDDEAEDEDRYDGLGHGGHAHGECCLVHGHNAVNANDIVKQLHNGGDGVGDKICAGIENQHADDGLDYALEDFACGGLLQEQTDKRDDAQEDGGLVKHLENDEVANGGKNIHIASNRWGTKDGN